MFILFPLCGQLWHHHILIYAYDALGNYQRPTPRLIATIVQWVGRICSNFGVDVKRLYELGSWRWRAFRERGLSKFTSDLFTDIMRIDRSYYIGKRVIDIGCGPRGSLEWLDDAARLSIPFDHSNFDQRTGTLLAALERLH
jgi:hypothetical protein